MTAQPIYLLDFRHGEVLEVDSAQESGGDDPLRKLPPSEAPSSGITFAALGSPIERKD